MRRSDGSEGDTGSLWEAVVGLRQALQLLVDDVPLIVGHRVHLLALELRRAREAAALVAGLLIAAALLLLTAWVALWIGLVSMLVDLGWGRSAAIGVAVLLNAAAGALMAWRAVALLPLLAVPATTRQLTRATRRDRTEDAP